MNKDIILQFIELIKGWNISSQIIAFLILLFAIAFFTIEKFRDLVMLHITTLLRINNANPMKHPFFLQKPMFLLQTNKIKFNSDNKTWLFITLLTIKIEVVYSNLIEFLKVSNWKKNNRYELQAGLLLLVEGMIKDYEEKILNAYIKRYPKVGKELFQIIYTEGFKPYHQKNIEYINQNIIKIFQLKSYDKKEILNSFILQIWVAIDTAISDCYIAFAKLNGHVDELINSCNE